MKRQKTYKNDVLSRKTMNVHIKILTQPEQPTIGERFNAMNKVYNSAGIDVNLASTEVLQGVEDLNDLDIGGAGGTNISPCSGTLTGEQDRLSEFRNGVPGKEVVVYICRHLTNANSGCAAHPESRPMAVITATAPLYTLAHEIGHLLGLKHPGTKSPVRLMNKGGTSSTAENDPLPILDESEIKKMRESTFLT
jgi:hypothetical protein